MNLNSQNLPIRINEVIDNSTANDIEDILLSPFVQWGLLNSTISADFYPEYDYDPRLLDPFVIAVHNINEGDILYDLTSKIVQNIENNLDFKIKRIVRLKSNTTFKDIEFKSDNFNIPHTDYPNDNYISAIYYVNDSDGDTCIFNDFDRDKRTLGVPIRKQPVKGSVVVFKSNTYHASSNPISNFRRVVLNIVLEV